MIFTHTWLIFTRSSPPLTIPFFVNVYDLELKISSFSNPPPKKRNFEHQKMHPKICLLQFFCLIIIFRNPLSDKTKKRFENQTFIGFTRVSRMKQFEETTCIFLMEGCSWWILAICDNAMVSQAKAPADGWLRYPYNHYWTLDRVEQTWPDPE